MSSINTNSGALSGLDRYNSVSAQLAQSNKRVSTGLKVADAFDNGAAFAIAQGLRSDNSALSAVNGQLGAAQGAVNVASAAATNVSNALSDVRSTLIQLADQNLSSNQRAQLQAQYNSQTQQINNQIGSATYNGTNLIASGAQNQSVIQDTSANQLTVQAQDLNAGAASLLTPVANANQAAALLNGGLQTAANNVGTALNSFAASSTSISSQINTNLEAANATEQGLGALVDADLAKTAALQSSQQVGQQLATQSLGIANAAPRVLGNLFGS
jgi:flagellin